MPEARQRTPRGLTRLDLIPLLAAGLIVVALRLHAYSAPLESDECNYAYFAERLLAGDRLYIDLWDHQPPGIFALLLLPTAVFGSSPAVYRTLALLAVLLTTLGVFAIARRWFDRPAAWAAVVLFALASSDPGVAGEGCNREIYMNMLLVAAWWALVRTPAASPRSIFVAGLLIGLASTIKTVVALHWLALIPAIVAVPPTSEAGAVRLYVKRVIAFAAGPALIWMVILTYFAADRRAVEFIDAAFVYNLIYSGGNLGWARRLVGFFAEKPFVFRTAWPLWLAGAAGLFAFPWRGGRVRSLSMAGWLLGSFLAICLPGKFWPHYYMLMLPPAVLLAAGGVHRIAAYRRAISLATAVAVCAALLAAETFGYLLVEPERIAHRRYGPRMGWVRDQARRVASVTEPQDTLYVWSSDAGFYYYSGRRCASRYTMNTALLGDHAFARAHRQRLARDLLTHRPRLIIIPFGREEPCPELVRFIQETQYVSVARTERMEVLCDLSRPVLPADWAREPPGGMGKRHTQGAEAAR